MVSLWILALLCLLSLGLAHQVAVNLKLVKFQRDKIKCLYIAKAAIQKAIAVLAKDDTYDVDTLNELWFKGYDEELEDGAYIFKDVEIGDGFFTIYNDYQGIPYYETGGEEENVVYGLTDEDSKININTADKELLSALFVVLQLDDPDYLADAVLYWRGNNPEIKDSYYESPDIPYPARKAHFKTIEELSLVKGFRDNWDLIEKCSIFFTVYTKEGLININTASREILKSVFMGLGSDAPDITPQVLSDILAEQVIIYRNGIDGVPATEDDVAINSEPTGIKAAIKQDLELNDPGKIWFEKQVFPFTGKSDLFRIEVTAKLKTSKIQRKVTAIVERGTKFLIKYWHEK